MVASVIFAALIVGTFAQSNTIIDVLKRHNEATLLSLIEAAGLTDTLASSGPFTIFAPKNQAFYGMSVDSLKSDPVALAELLKYHVVSGKVMFNDLKVNEKMLDSVAGPQIRVNYYHYNKHVAVEGALVSNYQRDYQADNGVVHLVYSVMYPPNGTITDILATTPDFSDLSAAITAAGLADALNDGPYTLLAPTNAAFSRLSNGTMSKLLANPDILKTILLYHVVHGSLYSTGIHSGSLPNLEQVDQEHVTASLGGSNVSINGARVTQKDISAVNGVVHAINHLLVPRSVAPALNNLLQSP